MPVSVQVPSRGVGTAALVGLLVSLPAVLSAQGAFQQTVVVTASARPIELGSVTRSLLVITREQIEALPAHSVADVLRLAASIDVRARGVRGVQTDFALRGATFGQMLMLVDGVRLNDAQSGHHNGDIPVPLEQVERIEVLYGPGSSLFGADAVGGTVNIVTRRAPDGSSLHVEGGSFGLMAGRAQGGFARGQVRETAAASFDRSSGFMYDRDFKSAILRSRTMVGESGGISLSYMWKEFGANNFYGGNAPSREWTNQMLLAADRRFGTFGAWSMDGQASYRTHGDRFVFNQLQPALSDNRHRTHEALASLNGARPIGGRGTLTLGLEGGGTWIRSTNLGDHSLSRISGYGEWRQEIRGVQVDGLLRVDRYEEFGASWNPSVGAGWWATSRLRLRASAARAFRVPTFTERYYSDPANLARADVGPETSWAGEGGVDVIARGWLLQATLFGRSDADVIDWLRSSPSERWQTYNVREVATLGVELGARRAIGTTGFVQAQYTEIDVDAAAVTQLSKYVLDYAPRSVTAAASIALPARLRVAPRVEYRLRSRSSGGLDYVLFDMRIARRIARQLDIYVDGTNLLDVDYQEINGVAMPGAAVSISIGVSAR